MQAVIQIAEKQYLVGSGDELLVNKLPPNKLLETFPPQVLLLIDGDRVRVGQPSLPDVSVEVSVLGEVKGKKIRVSKFKAKSRYRRTTGFRPKFTKLKIENISASATKAKNHSEKTPVIQKTTSSRKKTASTHP